jgi:hypothetical protein
MLSAHLCPPRLFSSFRRIGIPILRIRVKMSILVKQHALGKTREWPAAQTTDLRFTTQPAAALIFVPVQSFTSKARRRWLRRFCPVATLTTLDVKLTPLDFELVSLDFWLAFRLSGRSAILSAHKNGRLSMVITQKTFSKAPSFAVP